MSFECHFKVHLNLSVFPFVNKVRNILLSSVSSWDQASSAEKTSREWAGSIICVLSAGRWAWEKILFIYPLEHQQSEGTGENCENLFVTKDWLGSRLVKSVWGNWKRMSLGAIISYLELIFLLMSLFSTAGTWGNNPREQISLTVVCQDEKDIYSNISQNVELKYI